MLYWENEIEYVMRFFLSFCLSKNKFTGAFDFPDEIYFGQHHEQLALSSS